MIEISSGVTAEYPASLKLITLEKAGCVHL